MVEDEMLGASPHAAHLAPREALWGFQRGLEALWVKLWSWRVVAALSTFCCKGWSPSMSPEPNLALVIPAGRPHAENHGVEKPCFIQPRPGQSYSVVWPKYKK